MNNAAPFVDGLLVEGLNLSFAEPRHARSLVLQGVDLTVSIGETVALQGPSGCGKSTLLRAISGLEAIDSGRVCWRGVDQAQVPPHRRNFGLVFQDGQLFVHKTVAENISYGLRIQKVPAVERQQRVTELLNLVGLPGYEDRPVTKLSGGERQRVALARSLAPHPHLLLLDEPLSALDQELRERLATDLREILTTTHTTAIFVTHDRSEATAVADRVLRMESGRILDGSDQ